MSMGTGPRPLDVYERHLDGGREPARRWEQIRALAVEGASAQVWDRIAREVEANATALLELSHDIHAHPELNFQERHAAAAVATLLERSGHLIEVGTWGLETAFLASVGSGAPHVAILAEYDALPEVGHGCGHNVICAAAVGAFLGIAPLVSELGGRVSLYGTPAEEGGGGKEYIARAGGFEDVDAAIMVHPGGGDFTEAIRLGLRQVNVTYRGISAHAAATPFLGRNALDAAVFAYQGIAQLRQHMLPEDRVHMVITEGGAKPNIIPERASAALYIRSPTVEALEELTERVGTILRSAAEATATAMDIDWGVAPVFLPVRSNRTLASRYAAALRDRGRDVAEEYSGSGGSTDLGNVSVRVPAIHPNVAITRPEVPAHSHAFAAAAISTTGDAGVIDGAIGLARTAADFLADPDLRRHVRAEFEAAGGALDLSTSIL